MMVARIGKRDAVARPNFVRAWREKLVGSQERLLSRLAELEVSMSKASLSRMENGTQAISDAVQAALAEAIGVEAHVLMNVDPGSEKASLYADIMQLPEEDRRDVEKLVARLSRSAGT